MTEVNISQQLSIGYTYPIFEDGYVYNTIIPNKKAEQVFYLYDTKFFTPRENIFDTNPHNKTINTKDPFQQFLLAIVTNFKYANFTTSNNTHQTTKLNRLERRTNKRNLNKKNKVDIGIKKNMTKFNKLTQRNFRHVNQKNKF